MQQVLMPQLGESVTEGTLERWLVKPGDTVKKYEPLAEVITDKVNAEIPSSFSGVVKELMAEEGSTYAVGTVICTIDETNQHVERFDAPVERVNPIKQQNFEKTFYSSKRYSPAVRKLAAEYQIDLNSVNGTGIGGRITREDVRNMITKPKSVSLKPTKIQKEVDSGDIEIPVSQIRKAIAQHTLQSVQEIPHAWMMMEIDVTDIVNYRDEIKHDFLQREGVPLTYYPFFIKTVAQALEKYPMLNSVWATDKIIQKKDIHISIAIGDEDELHVPVIQHANKKSVAQIAHDIFELTNLTRKRQLKTHHITGGTFTVNNTGAFGSIQSMGIINYPQAAILQVEKIVKKPVLIQGDFVVPRFIVNICLSLDHRILDGYICGKFLQYVKELLENSNIKKMSVY